MRQYLPHSLRTERYLLGSSCECQREQPSSQALGGRSTSVHREAVKLNRSLTRGGGRKFLKTPSNPAQTRDSTRHESRATSGPHRRIHLFQKCSQRHSEWLAELLGCHQVSLLFIDLLLIAKRFIHSFSLLILVFPPESPYPLIRHSSEVLNHEFYSYFLLFSTTTYRIPIVQNG
jgi:hypothetical protein